MKTKLFQNSIFSFLIVSALAFTGCSDAFFDTAPKWISKLMSLRNMLVKLIGLKTSILAGKELLRKNLKIETGNGLGLFKIFSKSSRKLYFSFYFEKCSDFKQQNLNLQIS